MYYDNLKVDYHRNVVIEFDHVIIFNLSPPKTLATIIIGPPQKLSVFKVIYDSCNDYILSSQRSEFVIIDYYFR